MKQTKIAPLHIVLIEPEIPQNTGNIGRTCVGLGAPLHLVGNLGFSLDEKELLRAGLDYWSRLNWRHYPNWDSFLSTVPKEAMLIFLSTKGAKKYWDPHYRAPTYLVFGSESRGLPPSFYKTYKERLLSIPHHSDIRSLNLATAVVIAAYEAARQLKREGANGR